MISNQLLGLSVFLGLNFTSHKEAKVSKNHLNRTCLTSDVHRWTLGGARPPVLLVLNKKSGPSEIFFFFF